MVHRFEPQFSIQFSTLADELLADRSAGGDGMSGYIQSHGFHGRRYIPVEYDRPPSDRYAEVNLQDHVLEAERLGPYERQMLAEIVHAPHRLVVIVGYAGSGKTSTVLHVLEHYAKHRVKRVLEHPPKGGLYARIRAMQPSYMYVDFEPIWKKVAEKSHDDASAREALFEHWAAAMPSAVNRMLAGTKIPLQLLRDCVAIALRWATEQPAEFPNYCIPAVLTVFFHRFDGKLRDADSPEDAYKKVLTTLDGMPVEQRIEFWHAILDIIKLHSHEKDLVVAVYDNADPMDIPLQKAMQLRLDVIATSCVHKIIAPLRPAAFEVRAYSSEFNWYPHSGPSPVDILSQRLLNFVSYPELLTSYRDTPREQAHRAIGRALYLLLRLQRGYGYYRSLGRVLACMAGDSGRRMLEMAHSLFLSDQLAEAAETQIALVRPVRGRYELRAMIDRLATSLGEEIAAISEDVVLALDRGRSVDPEDLAVRLATTTDSVLANSLRVSNSDLLNVTANDVHAVLREPEVSAAAQSTIRESVQVALQLIARREDNEGRRRAVLESVCRRYRTLVQASLDRLGWKHRDAKDALYGFVSSFADLETPDAKPDETGADDALHALLELNKPFVPVQFVLRNRTSNVFAVADRASLCKLHILWFLAGLPRGSATVQQLVTTLRQLDHSDADILESVNEFVNQHIRLMWLDRSFVYPSIEALLGSPNHRVVMSRAGWGYQSALVSEIDYLLVKLGGPGLGLTAQIGKVVLGLRDLHEQESAVRARRDRPDGAPDGMFAAMRDVIVRAAAQFLDLAARHFRNLSRSNERDELRQNVVAYERLLGEVEVVPSARSTLKPAVLRSIDPHEIALTRVDAHRERAALQVALIGGRFWAEGMTPDEFHPGDPVPALHDARPRGPQAVG